MSEEHAPQSQLDAAYLALAHSKRRGTVFSLSFRPSTISQLADEQQLSLPAIYKHLRLLEEAELIQRRKAGRTNFIALNRKALRLAQAWLKQYNTDWGNDQETLENYITQFTTK